MIYLSTYSPTEIINATSTASNRPATARSLRYCTSLYAYPAAARAAANAAFAFCDFCIRLTINKRKNTTGAHIYTYI